jgi:hypothetical protein
MTPSYLYMYIIHDLSTSLFILIVIHQYFHQCCLMTQHTSVSSCKCSFCTCVPSFLALLCIFTLSCFFNLVFMAFLMVNHSASLFLAYSSFLRKECRLLSSRYLCVCVCACACLIVSPI